MVENGNFGLFFASKLWDIVGLPWRSYFQIREAPRVQFSQKRDEEDNGEGIRETRWLIYCFAAFKAKLLQNSALRTSRCFRPFTILKEYIKICKDGFVQFTIMDISYFGTFGLNSASVEQHIVLWGTCPLPKSYFALFLLFSYFSQIVGEINHIAYFTLRAAPFCGGVTLQMKSILQRLFNVFTLPALSSHNKYKQPRDDK